MWRTTVWLTFLVNYETSLESVFIKEWGNLNYCNFNKLL